MNRLLFTAAVATCLAASSAGYAAPANVDWAGFYAGLAAGHDFGNVKVTDIDAYNGPPPIKYEPGGFQITVQGGYNWTFDPGWVLGLEGEAGAFGFNGSAQYPPYIGVRGINDSRASIEGNALVAATGRAGYAFDNWLFFVKGGGVGADITASFVDSDPTGTTLVAGTRVSDFRIGYTGGGGIEYMIPSEPISLRVEYDYYDFGDMSQTTTSAGGSIWHFRHQITSNVAKAAVTYHF